ncbi:hypothetical protein H4R34_002536 [Dimargaris verticillata]|uniref:Transmembrane protein 198 n=1 Tax=Dimargaris verticillata TaxID=2761393 RepID=A0A9W8B3P8_9FUNG|nr:hypothetical protein H4R34_002536 [Dimargaris verticillata]
MPLALAGTGDSGNDSEGPSRPPLMGDQVVAGLFFILLGLYFYVAGARKFRVTLVLTGFLMVSMLVYYVCIKIRPAATDDIARRVIYMVVAMLLGLIFGFFYFFCDWLGLFGIGGVGGFCVAMMLLALHDNGLLQDNSSRGIFIAVWALAFGLLIFVFTEWTLKAATVIAGAYLMVLGVDLFARIGFSDHLTAFTHATVSDFYHPTRAATALIAVWIILLPLGLVIQHFTTRALRYHPIHQP